MNQRHAAGVKGVQEASRQRKRPHALLPLEIRLWLPFGCLEMAFAGLLMNLKAG
jgi:hypothetical protein